MLKAVVDRNIKSDVNCNYLNEINITLWSPMNNSNICNYTNKLFVTILQNAICDSTDENLKYISRDVT